MARKLAWLPLALAIPVGCSLDDPDRPPPQSDPFGNVAVGVGATTGSGGGGDGGAPTTTSSTTSGGGGQGGQGGSTGPGLGAPLYPFCGCFEAFNENNNAACATCVNDAKVADCDLEWMECLQSQNCMNIVNFALGCNLPYDQGCIDALAIADPSGVTPLQQFLQCACQDICLNECPSTTCQ